MAAVIQDKLLENIAKKLGGLTAEDIYGVEVLVTTGSGGGSTVGPSSSGTTATVTETLTNTSGSTMTVTSNLFMCFNDSESGIIGTIDSISWADSTTWSLTFNVTINEG